MNEYYITCPRGLEETTSLDISSYIKTPAIPDKGGVFFNGSLEDMYTINMFSRTGMFVLKKLFICFVVHIQNQIGKPFKLPMKPEKVIFFSIIFFSCSTVK